MATRLFIVGALASKTWPQRLAVTECTPIPNGLPGRVVFPARYGANGKPTGGVIENLAFHIKRGRIEEFSSPYTGDSRCIAREVTDPRLIAQIEESGRAVVVLQERLRLALAEHAETLASVAARCPVAKVTP